MKKNLPFNSNADKAVQSSYLTINSDTITIVQLIRKSAQGKDALECVKVTFSHVYVNCRPGDT